MLVAQTGRLATGQIIGFCSLVGISITLFVGIRAGALSALAWLGLAQLEASLSFDGVVKQVANGVAAVAFSAIVLVALHAHGPATISEGSAAVVAGLAFVLAAFVSGHHASPTSAAHEADDAWRRRHLAIAEALGDALVGFDGGGSLVYLTPRCEALLGARRQDLLCRGLFDQTHVADRPAFLKLVADAARGTEVVSAVFRLRLWPSSNVASGLAGQRHIWIEIRARGMMEFAGEGETNFVVAALRDVTASRERDLEIEAARLSTETAIRSKDHFLANMSHELRTPLNAIIGFSEMLASRVLRPDEPGKQREYAHIINQSGQHLLSVVNSILDMSKLQSGTFSIVPEPFDVVPLIDLCCDMITLKAQQGRIRLIRDYPSELEEIVGDQRACKQILINLLSNAIKFTPEHGEVAIRARPEGNALVISVADTGIGIAAADLTRLGDPFFQAGASLSRPYEGTGLGLSVVRGLIGLHGGAIAIASEVGHGTNVTIRLPLDCRVMHPKTPRATIETIARRPAAASGSSVDRRMKQSA